MKKIVLWMILLWSTFLLWCQKTPSSGETNNISETQQETFKWSTKDLLKKWDNVSCTFSFEDDETKEDGTIYVYNGQMKTTANVKIKNENLDLKTFTIIKKDYTYTRSDMQKGQGAKFKNIDDQWNEEQYTDDPLSNKDIDFTCKKITENTENFEIPTDINFIDITDYLKTQ